MGPKYHYNKFDKKVNISDEEKTEIPWWINNTVNVSTKLLLPVLTFRHTTITRSAAYIRKETTLV